MNKEDAEREKENDKTNVVNVNLENLEEKYIRILPTISSAFLYV